MKTLLLLGWLGLIVAAATPVLRYDHRAATPGVVPARQAATARPQLTMALHPRCACSRASLHELARLLQRLGDRVEAHALFVGGQPQDGSELRDLARRIPGLQLDDDPDGARGAHLGLLTSGELVLYGADGGLLFRGGLTASRGHEGATTAQDRIAQLIAGRTTQPGEAPVFGCQLQRNP